MFLLHPAIQSTIPCYMQLESIDRVTKPLSTQVRPCSPNPNYLYITLQLLPPLPDASSFPSLVLSSIPMHLLPTSYRSSFFVRPFKMPQKPCCLVSFRPARRLLHFGFFVVLVTSTFDFDFDITNFSFSSALSGYFEDTRYRQDVAG